MPEGGLRDRLIDAAMFNKLKEGLASQGWFDAGRQHRPIKCIDAPVEDDEQIAPNIVAMSSEGVSPTDLELGSNATVETFDYWFDIYAESDAVGKHLSGDIRAVFQGHFPADGFSEPVVDVYDQTMATPAKIFSVDVVSTDRARNRNHVVATSPARHWWTVLVAIEDTRGE